MRLNTFFLIIGGLLSIVSKLYQFKIKAGTYIGNIIVMPAGICLCLAILFSFQKFNTMFFNVETKPQALLIALSACVAVVSFQLMMISFLSYHTLYGILCAIPFVIFLVIFIKNWFF